MTDVADTEAVASNLTKKIAFFFCFLSNVIEIQHSTQQPPGTHKLQIIIANEVDFMCCLVQPIHINRHVLKTKEQKCLVFFLFGKLNN